MVRVNSCSTVLPSVGLAFMLSLLYGWIGADTSLAVLAIWIALPWLMIVVSFPVDFLRIRKATGSRRDSIRPQEPLASHDFILGARFRNDELLVKRSNGERRGIRRRILSQIYPLPNDNHFSRLDLVPETLLFEDLPEMPVAQHDLYRVIIDLEAFGRHA